MHSTLLDFAAREGIDIMILGSKESKGTVQKLVQPGGMGASTSDTVKSKSKCPCLIVRPAVRFLDTLRTTCQACSCSCKFMKEAGNALFATTFVAFLYSG